MEQVLREEADQDPEEGEEAEALEGVRDRVEISEPVPGLASAAIACALHAER